MTELFVKLGVRLLIFGLVFFLVAYKHERITVKPRWAIGPIAILFALLNTGFYWLLKPVFNLATLWTMWFITPLVINGVLLYATIRLLPYLRLKEPLQVKGVKAWAALVGVLTLTHGVLWVILDNLIY